MTISNRVTGMRGFITIWLGQIVSLIGSAMTWFGLTLWAWEQTGKASTLATIGFFAFLPAVLFAPLAGAFVDRWNRKLVLLLSDLATALGTLAIFLLFTCGALQVWHIYVISLFAGFFTAFQYPAYAAAVTTMLSKEDFARAEGLLGAARALSGILSPLLAAALLKPVGLRGLMLIDLSTFLCAFATLLVIRVPQPAQSELGRQSRGALFQEITFGFKYIKTKKSLLWLTLLFMATGFFLAMGATLTSPLVLSRTQNSESALAAVQAAGAVGGIVGGVLLSIWGGAKQRIHNILIGGAGACLLGIVWLGLARTLLLWSLGNFFFAFFEPYVEGGNLAIWQTKVPADVQGRVFSARHLLVQLPYLLGTLSSGYLAEAVNIASVLIFAGAAGALIFILGYIAQPIRSIETLLSDAEAA